MAKVVPSLNLNKHPREIQNGSLVNALNVQLSKDGTTFTNEHSIILNEKLKDINEEIAGVISCTNELIIFTKSNKIYRYNEKANETFLCVEGYDYGGGEINGNFTYNVNNNLIIIFNEYNSIVSQPIKTINLGTWETKEKFVNKEYLFPLVPEVKIPTIDFEFNDELWYKGWNFIYIRYKINNKGDYTQWYNTNFNVLIDKSDLRNIIEGKLGIYNQEKEINDNKVDIFEFTSLPTIKSKVSNDKNITNRSITITNLYNIDKERYSQFQLATVVVRKDSTECYRTNDLNIDITNIKLTPKTFCERDISVDELNSIYVNYYNTKVLNNYKNKIYFSNFEERKIEDFTDFIKNGNVKIDLSHKCYVSNATNNIDVIVQELLDKYKTNTLTYKNKELNISQEGDTFTREQLLEKGVSPVNVTVSQRGDWTDSYTNINRKGVYSKISFGEYVELTNYSIQVNGRHLEETLKFFEDNNTDYNYLKYLKRKNVILGDNIDYEYIQQDINYIEQNMGGTPENPKDWKKIFYDPGTKHNLRLNIKDDKKTSKTSTLGGTIEIYCIANKDTNPRIFHSIVPTYWYRAFAVFNYNYKNIHPNDEYCDTIMLFGSYNADTYEIKEGLNKFIFLSWLVDTNGYVYDEYNNETEDNIESYLNISNGDYICRNNDNTAVLVSFKEHDNWYETTLANLIYIPVCVPNYGGHLAYIEDVDLNTVIKDPTRKVKVWDSNEKHYIETSPPSTINNTSIGANIVKNGGTKIELKNQNLYLFNECFVTRRDKTYNNNVAVDAKIYHYSIDNILENNPENTFVKNLTVSYGGKTIDIDNIYYDENGEEFIYLDQILSLFNEDVIKFTDNSSYARPNTYTYIHKPNIYSDYLYYHTVRQDLVDLDKNNNLKIYIKDKKFRKNNQILEYYDLFKLDFDYETEDFTGTTLIKYDANAIGIHLTPNNLIISNTDVEIINVETKDVNAKVHFYDENNSDITDKLIDEWNTAIEDANNDETSSLLYKEYAENPIKYRTLNMKDVYHIYIHFVDKYGNSTPGYYVKSVEAKMPSNSTYEDFINKLKTQTNWIKCKLTSIPNGYVGWYLSYSYIKIVTNVGAVTVINRYVDTVRRPVTNESSEHYYGKNYYGFISSELAYKDKIDISFDEIYLFRKALGSTGNISDYKNSDKYKDFHGAGSFDNLGMEANIELTSLEDENIKFGIEKKEIDISIEHNGSNNGNRAYYYTANEALLLKNFNEKDIKEIIDRDSNVKTLIPFTNIIYEAGEYLFNNDFKHPTNIKVGGGYYNGFHTVIETLMYNFPMNVDSMGIAYSMNNITNTHLFRCFPNVLDLIKTPFTSQFVDEYKSFKQEPFKYIISPDPTVSIKDSTKERTSYVDAKDSQDLYMMKHLSLDDAYLGVQINYRDDRIYKYKQDKRILRTSVIQSESTVNNWRKTELTNYLDLTENKGEINNLLGIGTKFIIHSKYALFLIETRNTIRNTQGADVQVSDKDVFDCNYIEVTPTKLGTSGLVNIKSWIHGIYGYVWYDDSSNRFYIFNDNGIKFIDSAIYEWLKEYKLFNVIFCDDIDNSRLIIKGEYSRNKIVIFTYNYITNSFVSLHTYNFKEAFSTKDKIYLLENNKFYNFDEDTHSVFNMINTKFQESKLSFIVNTEFDKIKFVNYVIYKLFARDKKEKSIYDSSPVKERNTEYSGNYIRIYNEFIDTGKINVSTWTKNINEFGKPYSDLGNWNFNLLRNNPNLVQSENIETLNDYYSGDKVNEELTYDTNSRLFGNYFIIEFYFTQLPDNIDKFEFEGFDVDLTLRRT